MSFLSKSNSIASGSSEDISSPDLQKNISIQESSLAVLSGNSSLTLQDIKPQTWGRSLLQDIAILQKLYQKKPSQELLESLISKLVQNYQFDEAYELVADVYSKGQIEGIEPSLFIYVMLNSQQLDTTTPRKIEDIVSLIQLFESEKKISYDESRFFIALIDLVKGNKQSFYKALETLTDKKYQTFKQQIVAQQQLAKNQLGAPEYYENALLALVILKNGYFKIAMNVASIIVNKNPSYILPQQILAYGNLMTNQWQLATDYLLQLQDLDTKNSNYYKAMLGMASYRNNKPKDAILYLNQLPDSEKSLDVIRVMLLAYLQLWDETNIASVMKKLLAQGVELTKSDYMIVFDTVFFDPYKQGLSWTIYQSNSLIFLSFLSSCKNILPEDQQYVCQYGQAGQFLITQQAAKAKILLEKLAKIFPSSVVYQSLGALAFNDKQYDEAKQWYIKAATSSTQTGQQEMIKKWLLQIETRALYK